jgi:hypothetical protein
VEIRLPAGDAHGLVAIQATWINEQGQEMASGDAEVAWLSPQKPIQRLHVADDPALARALRGLGYRVVRANRGEPDVLTVARHYNADLRDAVQDGASVLLLAPRHHTPEVEGTAQEPRRQRARRLAAARAESQGLRLPVGSLRPRQGTPWQGDWATSFSWLKKSGPFANLPGEPLLGMEYAAIMPDAVLTGLPAWAMRDHCWAGLALGWVHKPVALVADVPYGRGKVTISTFNLTEETLVGNAVAEVLLAGLIQLAQD